MSKSKHRKRRNSGRGPSGKQPNPPKQNQAYLKDLDGVGWELVAQKNHNLRDLHGYRIGCDDGTGLAAEVGLSLAEEHVKPATLAECGPAGHQRQAWNVMTGEQAYAQPCEACGETPEFSETWSGMDELGFVCEEVIEDIGPGASIHHELNLYGNKLNQFGFSYRIERVEWPEKGSTNITHHPYPGDDAITVQWLIEELAARGNMPPDTPVTNPENRALFTDDFLREYLKSECKDWTPFTAIFAVFEPDPDDVENEPA